MVIKLNTFLLFSSYYSSSDPISGILGLLFLFLIGFFCCKSLNDDTSSNESKTNNSTSRYYYDSSTNLYIPKTDNSNRRYGSSGTRSYDEDELNYNWDDSWDDKWLHQGEYADVVDTHSEENYTDYDPSWDEQWRED